MPKTAPKPKTKMQEGLEFISKHSTPKDRLKVLRSLNASTTPENENELNIWDKKRWLVLEDFWLDRITQEHADELIKKIGEDESARRK